MKTLNHKTLRGVNLGNWLLLEKWMSPTVFEGVDAIDEYTLCQSLGRGAEWHLARHRETFITESDFRWLRRRGINAVRIPFGYWLFIEEKPFVSGAEHLDRAIALAEKHGLKVVLDLHGLPGCQGPNDHTGRAGYFRWHKDPRNISRSLEVIEQIAQRYARNPGVIGFEVANEPDPAIDKALLMSFYEQACERVRRHMSADNVAFVINAFPEGELGNYPGALGERANVWIDVHLYQNFGDWSDWHLLDYLAYPLERQKRLREHIARGPVIVGEWSLSMAPPLQRQVDAMPGFQRDALYRSHANLLLAMLEEYRGWFFWSYRVEGKPHWSFRDAVDRGWLPEGFDDVAAVAERSPPVVNAKSP